MVKRTQVQLMEKHLKDAAYWRATAARLIEKADAATEKAKRIKAEGVEVARG